MFWCLDLTTAESRVTILLDKYNLDPRWPSAAICSIVVFFIVYCCSQCMYRLYFVVQYLLYFIVLHLTGLINFKCVLDFQDLFQQFWKKIPGQKWEKMIDLTAKLGEINAIEHNKGSKIYPQNQVILHCIMPTIPCPALYQFAKMVAYVFPRIGLHNLMERGSFVYNTNIMICIGTTACCS